MSSLYGRLSSHDDDDHDACSSPSHPPPPPHDGGRTSSSAGTRSAAIASNHPEEESGVDGGSPPRKTSPTQRPMRLLNVVTSLGQVAFPFRLHTMLDDAERKGFAHIVAWLRDAKSFKVHDHDQFTQLILPTYFEGQTQYRSFQRQLNIYGFSRYPRGPNKGAYTHTRMLRGQPEACRLMVRTKIKKKGIHTPFSTTTKKNHHQDDLTTAPHQPNNNNNKKPPCCDETVNERKEALLRPCIAKINKPMDGCLFRNSGRKQEESAVIQEARCGTVRCSTALPYDDPHFEVVAHHEERHKMTPPSVPSCHHGPRYPETDHDALNMALLEAKGKLLTMLLQTIDRRIISFAMNSLKRSTDGQQVAKDKTAQERLRPSVFLRRLSSLDCTTVESNLGIHSQRHESFRAGGTTGLEGSSLEWVREVEQNRKVQPRHGTFDDQEGADVTGVFARNCTWNSLRNEDDNAQQEENEDDQELYFEPLTLDHGDDSHMHLLDDIFEI